MPKIESERISAADGEILEKVAIFVSARSHAKKPKMGILRGDRSNSILPQVKPPAKRRGVFKEDKYAPGSGSKWKRMIERFPALYKALLAEPDAAACSAM